MKILIQKFLILSLCAIAIYSCSKSDLGFPSNQATSGVGGTSKSGSITKFAIIENYMYLVNGENIKVYDITNNASPVFIKEVKLGFGLETIFNYGNKLYVGAVNGIFIVDISDPTTPKLKSHVTHEIGCDPVVVTGNYAYSTVKMGRQCGSFMSSVSALMIYDVTDENNPILLNSISLSSPRGLAINNNELYICDENNGVQLYDITTKLEPSYIKSINVLNPIDAIIDGNILIVSAKNGFYFYDISNLSSIVLLKSIEK